MCQDGGKKYTRERVEELFNSLKKRETFSDEMCQLIKNELERVSKEAIEYNRKKNEAKRH